jgi:hypothetical protein
LIPITKAMIDGKEPLRTFSDLLQFCQQQPDPTPATAPATGQKTESAQSPAESQPDSPESQPHNAESQPHSAENSTQETAANDVQGSDIASETVAGASNPNSATN